ncbi:MAG: M17 family peptidase N-terminal domain-containing protein, partial [Marmoricola sp.]
MTPAPTLRAPAADAPTLALPGLPDQVSPPELLLDAAPPSRVDGVTVVALPVLASDDGPELGPGCAEAEDDFGVDLLSVLEDQGRTGATGEVTVVPVSGRSGITTVLLVGVGDATPAAVRRAAAAMARAVPGDAAVAGSVHDVGGDDHLVAFVEGAVLASFSFTLAAPAAEDGLPVRRIVLAGTPEDAAGALARGLVLARAGWLSRTRARVPPNKKYPAWRAHPPGARGEEGRHEVEGGGKRRH